jgi:nitrogen regulatory protein PII
MKLIEAIIPPFKLDEVQHALSKINVHGLTVCEVQEFGRQKGQTIQYRGTTTTAHFVPKLRLQVVVSDEEAPRVEEALGRSARTGNVGDGKIFVFTLDHVSRIRTGEKGNAAL